MRAAPRHRGVKAKRTSGAVLMVAALLGASCGGGDRAEVPCGERPAGHAIEIVYEVEGGTATRTMAKRVCDRLTALGAGDVLVRPAGEGRIRVVTPDPREARAAIEGSALRFYDWERSVLGPRGPDAPFVGAGAFFDAVELASGSPSTVAQNGGDRFYLFGADRRLLAGPASSRAELLAGLSQPPAGSRLMRVPAGVAVVEDARGTGPAGRYFAIEDEPELSNDDVERPRAEPDPVTDAPVLLFDFTASGRRAFKRLTARVANRGDAGHIAIVVDDRLLSLPTIDSATNPNGIDAPGGQVGPIGSAETTRRLARSLAGAPLADRLRLVAIGERSP
jgi:preprotein translocase subunit SecD